MSIKKLTLSAMLLGCVLMATACQPASPPFQEALDKHFNSIIDRDIEAYKSTITKGDTLPMIFPDGSFLNSRADVEEFHANWFKNENWRMSFEEVNRIIGKDIASILVRTAYRDTPEGAPRFAYLTVTFQLQEGEWRLVHDQNTRINLPVQIAPPAATDTEN